MPVSRKRKKAKGKSGRASGRGLADPNRARTFHVHCLIAGPKLPEGELSLGRFEIFRVPVSDVQQIDQTVPDLTMQIGNEPHVVSVFPGYSQVKTEWMISFNVDAPDAAEAQADAERRLLPEVLGVLDTSTDSWRPFRARVIGVVDAETGQNSYFFNAFAIPLRRREEMGPENSEMLVRRLATLEHNDVARHAVIRMRQAVELLDIGRDTFEDLAVLRMFTAIEGIVADVVRRERPNLVAGLEQEIAQLVDELEEMLAASAEDTRGRVQAVRETMGKIREKNLETIRRQIGAAGEVLGVDGRDVQDALDLAKFRNERLGHFANVDSPNGLGRWAEHRAFELCKIFLSRYLDLMAVDE